ncbi:hypothetical protein [Lentzea tibetensis]|nr:hypothetical protein [Lentzea tibetensis]
MVRKKANPPYLGGIMVAVRPERGGGVIARRPGVDEGSNELVEQVGT